MLLKKRHMRFAPFGIAVMLTGVAVCAQPSFSQASGPKAATPPPLIDARAKFRELFCGLLAKDAEWGGQPCDAWLRRMPGEAVQESSPAPLPNLQSKYDVLLVPGIFGECVKNAVTIFGDAAKNLRQKGVQSEMVEVRGRASSEHNAKIVRDAVMRHAADRPGRRIVLVTYSKGTADSLVALGAYPEIVPHVVALVSFAGVVKGSPLADRAEGVYGATIGLLPFAACPVVDVGEMQSLTRAERTEWLSTHTLPPSVRFYSVVAVPELARVSAVLLGPYLTLAATDPRNDSQVFAEDAAIPGSKLLGHANADHWAIAIPFNTAPAPAALLVTQNRFPRPQLLEAALLMVEGDD